ncbi:MAG TPA: CPCC family cysteine-rich protein [Candidatus Limnocylindria bacterium]|nr:CPCC family cysteine-rich protein [Candidatus Limnocylindria bacterium]
MNGDLHERRKWFKEYFESTNAMVRRSRPRDFWFTCPACGYPTHLERGGFDICKVCCWEDDGQDDADADVVRGGPNGDLSLTEARENFAAHRTIYRPTSDALAAGVLIVILEAIRQADYSDHALISKLWKAAAAFGPPGYANLPD